MVKSEKILFFQYRRADGLIAAFIQVINQRYIGVISTPYFTRLFNSRPLGLFQGNVVWCP